MKTPTRVLYSCLLFCLSACAQAGLLSPFKDEDGETKWQYVANFSSGVLIITLLALSVFLFFAHRKATQSNRELTDIKATLQERVASRTKSLEATTTQLAHSEAYVKSIVDSMPIMLIGLNNQMAVTQWNHVAEKITGLPFSAVKGLNLWDAFPTITLSPKQVEKVLMSKATTTIKRSQRGQYYFDITMYTLADGTDTGIVILVDDITKHMKAENQLVERNKMSAMGELASAMAHDINIPLQRICSAIDSLHEQLSDVDEKQRKALIPVANKAQESGEQATAIVQNLLSFAASHGDSMTCSNIAELLDHSLTLAGTLYSQPNGLRFNDIAVHRNYDADAPSIPCYASEIQQVFLRLLRHAFHAICEKVEKNSEYSPVIHVEVGEFYESAWIKIQHNGVGLSPEEQHDVFEPFFSNSSDRPACPVEHRLSYSHFIVTEHHKGHIAVTSGVDVGTTFHMQLPLK
jgi:PAS domain S-box-containing protein